MKQSQPAIDSSKMAPNLLPYEDALAHMLARAEKTLPAAEVLPLQNANGRLLAKALQAPMDIPQEARSTMDGYAVRVSEVGATPLPISQRITAGNGCTPLKLGSAARIFTGAPLPLGADAIVIQEDCKEQDGHVHIDKNPQIGQWIRFPGTDLKQGSIALPQGAYLGPAQLGLAATTGYAEVQVYRRLKVGVLSTGNELVMPGTPLAAGQTYDANHFTLAALLHNPAWEVSLLGTLPDQRSVVEKSLREASESYDVLITSGGMSVGEEDHVRAAVERQGEIEMWHLAIKPGKPFTLGRIGRAHFLGLPGNPVSTFITSLLLVLPFLRACAGAQLREITPLLLRADFSWLTPDTHRREFLRVRRVGDTLALHPQQISSVLKSCAWANGLVSNSPGNKIQSGDMVQYLSITELIAGPQM